MLPMFPARYAAQTGETRRDTLTEHSYTATVKNPGTKRILEDAGFDRAGQIGPPEMNR